MPPISRAARPLGPRGGALALLCALSGCLSLPIDTADTASLGATSGVAVWSRMADGAARADVVIRAGSFRADPGQDGVAIFTTVVPGRAPVRVVVDDEDATWGTVDIAPLQLHGIQLVAPELVPLTLEAVDGCLLYTSPSPRDATLSRMPSSA